MNNETSTKRDRIVLPFHVEDPADGLLPSRAENLQCSSPKKVIQLPAAASFSHRKGQFPGVFHGYKPLSFYGRFSHFLHTLTTFLFVTCNNWINLDCTAVSSSGLLISRVFNIGVLCLERDSKWSYISSWCLLVSRTTCCSFLRVCLWLRKQMCS